MTDPSNPYDELPYCCYPVEWTSPEQLALVSLLHGGPRIALNSPYRVLELGCGNGANVLPMAYYRRQGSFVGVDGALSQIEIAELRRRELGLSNLEFLHADFTSANERLEGEFDIILAHGVFSWIPPNVREAFLELVARRLRRGGLLYLNYNSRPGWNIRGLVREFLLAQTAGLPGLHARARFAQEVAGTMASALEGPEHPYSRLMANEFRFVREGNITWVGHEFLAEYNQPYWRSEFLALAGLHRLEYVADADFNRSSGRVPEDLSPKLAIEQITGRSVEDTIDLLCYRQLHSPILTPAPFQPTPSSLDELGKLRVASCLEACPAGEAGANPIFKHPNGYEVEAREPFMDAGLAKLRPLWPRGARVDEIFPDVAQAAEDLRLLHRNGLIELRCIEPEDCGVSGDLLNERERAWGGYHTTPYHGVYLINPASN